MNSIITPSLHLSASISLFRLQSNCPHTSPPPVIDEPPPSPSYIIENGIPPGSILVNPHTGTQHTQGKYTHDAGTFVILQLSPLR